MIFFYIVVVSKRKREREREIGLETSGNNVVCIISSFKVYLFKLNVALTFIFVFLFARFNVFPVYEKKKIIFTVFIQDFKILFIINFLQKCKMENNNES